MGARPTIDPIWNMRTGLRAAPTGTKDPTSRASRTAYSSTRPARWNKAIWLFPGGSGSADLR